MGCLDKNWQWGKGRDWGELGETKGKGTGHVLPCYWWVYLSHWRDSAWSQPSILYPLEILLPITFYILSVHVSVLVSFKVGWLATRIRVGASNWRRSWSRGWLLGRLGVPDQLLERPTSCMYIPIAAFSADQPEGRRGLSYLLSCFCECWVCSCGCQ